MSTDHRCQRCDIQDQDLRTLRMSCGYDMQELQLPFELMPFRNTPSVEGHRKYTTFYTLRVCKTCRADWMDTIGIWFRSPSTKLETGTGVFVRDRGTARELTTEEIAATVHQIMDEVGGYRVVIQDKCEEIRNDIDSLVRNFVGDVVGEDCSFDYEYHSVSGTHTEHDVYSDDAITYVVRGISSVDWSPRMVRGLCDWLEATYELRMNCGDTTKPWNTKVMAQWCGDGLAITLMPKYPGF